ncbi:protein 5NUC [Frankliniella occidentalis]|uniref:5'-nucleotidase n=1 Tax=Frankliniella occidentalis TaxID=133901 RepID=A0A9C6XW21_FRAOC|nr:protein 5NUC [Frankliniella occidentalis]
MHARYEQTNALSGSCSDKDAQAGHCYGGQARVATIVKQARAADPNVLVLNAGDMYQGTVYYSVFKSSISAEFINIMKYDAITLGNHEFDDKTVGLVPFIEQLKVPLVVANADFSQQPELNKLNIKKSVVVEKGGVKIGIIGYLTPETAFLSSPENVVFLDEVEALKAEAAALKAQGVNIIIGLGHSGYDKDKVIARKVPDIDIVVGGHSHSFLFGKSATDAPPDSDVPVGLYPTWIEQASGRKVPVVQAYAFTKYMGSLKLKFDANGELTNLEGGPILLNKDVEEDKDTLAEVLKWKSQLDEKVLQPIGRTTVLLDGSSCRRQECNLGNLIADAFVYSRAVNVRSEKGWTDAAIALVNGGSIRESIDASSVGGTITLKDVMEVMPFDNLEVLLRIRGTVLLQALEHGVSEYVPGQAWKGAFLQLSGVHVVYDVSRPAGQRVVSAEVRCESCTIPSYAALDPNALYGVIVSGFLAGGGDGFSMLENNEGALRLENTATGCTAPRPWP